MKFQPLVNPAIITIDYLGITTLSILRSLSFIFGWKSRHSSRFRHPHCGFLKDILPPPPLHHRRPNDLISPGNFIPIYLCRGRKAKLVSKKIFSDLPKKRFCYHFPVHFHIYISSLNFTHFVSPLIFGKYQDAVASRGCSQSNCRGVLWLRNVINYGWLQHGTDRICLDLRKTNEPSYVKGFCQNLTIILQRTLFK